MPIKGQRFRVKEVPTEWAKRLTETANREANRRPTQGAMLGRSMRIRSLRLKADILRNLTVGQVLVYQESATQEPDEQWGHIYVMTREKDEVMINIPSKFMTPV